MTASTKTTLLGAAVAFALAAIAGGRVGFAVALGYFVGALSALVIGRAQRAVVSGHPGYALHLVGAGFLIKVFLLLAVILAARVSSAEFGALECRTFALAFAGAMLILMPAATIDLLKSQSLVQSVAQGLEGAPRSASATGRTQGTVS